MEHLKIDGKLILLILVIVGMIQSCYYDNEEELYPVPSPCDTTNVTYTQSVWPIISNNCTNCHSGSTPSGNISLENYDEIAAAAHLLLPRRLRRRRHR